MYKIIFDIKLDHIPDKINYKDENENRKDVLFSSNFNYYLKNEINEKLSIILQEKYKNIINVFNKYEPNAINIKNNITNSFNKHFAKYPKIISNEFFHIWELQYNFSNKSILIKDNDTSYLQALFYKFPENNYYLINDKMKINDEIIKLSNRIKTKKEISDICIYNEIIIDDILFAINNKSDLIVKFDNLYNLLNNKLIILFNMCYEKVVIQKPQTMNLWDNNIFIICSKNKNKKIIEGNYQFDHKYLESISKINGKLLSKLHNNIMKIHDFIINEKYFSDDNDKYIEIQNNGSKEYITTFLK